MTLDKLENNLVSIIIPTHNRVSLLVETLNSILQQEYTKIEIIVVDDYSSDGTYETMLQFQSRYPCVRYYRSKSKGACAARHLGFFYSLGNYVQFMDDDDLVNSQYISKRVSILDQNPALDFVACNMIYFKDKPENVIREHRIDNIPHDIYHHLLLGGFSTQLYLFRKNSLAKLGNWDESCLKYQDVRFYHRIFLLDLSGVWLEDFLYYIRLHNTSISNNFDALTLNSVIDVFSSIKNEWKNAGMLDRKLLNIISYLSLAQTSKLLRIDVKLGLRRLLQHMLDFRSVCSVVFFYLRNRNNNLNNMHKWFLDSL